ncbi:hypothetical protein [Streptomyces griseocarneus]|uniref:hypothetical protein n=1 Tax=Streptomyces griseocarneus TaxID=51201 RepID=UPI00167D9175|nr:hypothetical protein [Streptomyces griseocarneus]MBZ6477975.1 hypothetical protein [Streptomyces griseocarneus]GHG54594.1 hypothetical protein GCM10018779_17680 [Streptomyces griseocarneus]
MKSRNFRLAPAVAVATAGLLFAGTAGTAVAAPSEETPNATSSAVSEEVKGDWKPGAWYDDEAACKKAGEQGKQDHKWSEYRCKREERHTGQYDYQWHLYYHR